MPTYDFICPNDHVFEVFQKMSAHPVTPCPECGEDAERRISGGTGFLSRGSSADGGSSRRGRSLDGGSTSGEPPHAPVDRSTRR